jgi:hypothetical protein
MCRTFCINGVNPEQEDGAFVQMCSGSLTPVQQVGVGYHFYELPTGGDLVFMHLSPTAGLSVVRVSVQNPPPYCSPFRVLHGDLMFWYALRNQPGEVATFTEYSVPGFTEQALTTLKLSDLIHSCFNKADLDNFWDLWVRLKSGEDLDVITTFTQ